MARVLIGTYDFPFDRERYQREFDVVELGVTRTSPPKNKVLRRWGSAAPADFEHILLAWQSFTHSPREIRAGRKIELRDGEHAANLGHFLDTPENRRVWRLVREGAQALGARTILLETPASLTPSVEHKERMRRFSSDWAELPDDARLIWSPSGFWEREEAIALTDELGWTLAVDPLLDLDEPLPEQPLTYFRMLGTQGLGGSYGDYELERLAELAHATQSEDTIVIFRTRNAIRDAGRFKRLMSGLPEQDLEDDDDDDFDPDDFSDEDFDDDGFDDDDDFGDDDFGDEDFDSGEEDAVD